MSDNCCQDDEIHACAKLGSLVARKNRILDIQRINAENVLGDLANKKRIKPGTGAPSNRATHEWLSLHRKICPYSDFRSRVRLKWQNVKRIEEELPKKTLHLVFECNACGKKTNNVKIRYDGAVTSVASMRRLDCMLSDDPHFKRLRKIEGSHVESSTGGLGRVFIGPNAMRSGPDVFGILAILRIAPPRGHERPGSTN